MLEEIEAEQGWLSDSSDSSFDDDEYDSDFDEEYSEEISEDWYDHEEEYYDQEDEWYEYLFFMFYWYDENEDESD